MADLVDFEFKRDGENLQILLRVVDSAGAAVTKYGSITIGLDDVAGLEVKMREVQVCDPDTGTTKYMMVLGSEMYTESREEE